MAETARCQRDAGFMMLKKSAFYIFAALFIFAGQFLVTSGLVTGTPPPLATATLSGQDPKVNLANGPALLYFWAEWCSVCRGMQSNVSAILSDTPGMTVAMRSGDGQKVIEYLHANQLEWPVVNDSDGAVGDRYGVRAVPALFFLDRHGNIAFTSAGYTSEWGLRFRLWLVGLL